MLTEYVNSLIEARTLLNQGLAKAQPMLIDQSIPLDERWDAYVKLVDNSILVREDIYSDGFLGEIFGHNKVSPYDDFHMERGNSSTFPEIWERITDEYFDNDTYSDPELRNKWREKVLASGYSEFTYDW